MTNEKPGGQFSALTISENPNIIARLNPLA